MSEEPELLEIEEAVDRLDELVLAYPKGFLCIPKWHDFCATQGFLALKTEDCKVLALNQQLAWVEIGAKPKLGVV